MDKIPLSDSDIQAVMFRHGRFLYIGSPLDRLDSVWWQLRSLSIHAALSAAVFWKESGTTRGVFLLEHFTDPSGNLRMCGVKRCNMSRLLWPAQNVLVPAARLIASK